MEEGHLPVMPVEVLGTLAPAPGSLQIDATVGGGGHTERILEAASPDGRVLGLDADQAAIDRVAQPPRRGSATGSSCARRTSGELADVAPAAGSAPSTARCSTSACPRSSSPTASGASASGPAARSTCASTRRRGVPAAELLATLDADELAALFRRYGEEPSAWRIAKAIVAARATAPIETAEDLAQLVERVAPGNPRQPPPDPPRDARVPGAPDRGQRGARRARRGRSRPPSTCCGPAAASSSCPTTRSRTASSSGSSTPSAGAAPARPRRPSASAATRRASAS